MQTAVYLHQSDNFHIFVVSVQFSVIPPPFCVLEQKTLLPEKSLVISRKRWLRPDMTEKLLSGTLSLNTNKHIFGQKDRPQSISKACEVILVWQFFGNWLW